MPGRRERTHVAADLDDQGVDGNGAQPRHLLQAFDNVAKGSERGLDVGVEGSDSFLQLLDRMQMLRQ